MLRIDGDRALVQTVDFFTPIVDDPYVFGAIAAANSISDVYAMGAEPILGLAIAGFPIDVLPRSVLGEILRGGAEKAAEAGFPVAGGHTIIDDVPKYGLAVTGVAPVDRIVRNSTAKAGDRIYLTKPIGSGVLISAWRQSTLGIGGRLGLRKRPVLDTALEWMMTLNRDASRCMVEAGASAATDVTGYGLIGHLLEMCEGAGLGARIDGQAVPLLEQALEYATRGIVPEGTLRNATTFRSKVTGQFEDPLWRLLCDAQTSGGLLIAIPPGRAARLEELLRERGVFHALIGEFVPGAGTIAIEA